MAFIQPSDQPSTPAWDPNFQYDTGLQGIKLRQALAQQITNDQQPTNTQVVDGWAVKQGAATPVANAFNRIMGMYLQGKNLDDLHNLGAQSNENLKHALSEDTTTTPDDTYIHANPMGVGPQPDTPDQSDAETNRLNAQAGNVPTQSAAPVPSKVLAAAVSDLKANPQAAVAAATAVNKTKAAAADGGINVGNYNPGADAQAAYAAMPNGGLPNPQASNTPYADASPSASDVWSNLKNIGSMAGDRMVAAVQSIRHFTGADGSPFGPSAANSTPPPTPPTPTSTPAPAPVQTPPPAPTPQALGAAISPQAPPATPQAPPPAPVINQTPPSAPVQPAAPAPVQNPITAQAMQAIRYQGAQPTGVDDELRIPGVPVQDQGKVQQQIIDLANSGPMGQQYASAILQRNFRLPDWDVKTNEGTGQTIIYNRNAPQGPDGMPLGYKVLSGTGGKLGIEQDRTLNDAAARVDPNNPAQVAAFRQQAIAAGKNPDNYPVGPSAVQAADATKTTQGNALERSKMVAASSSISNYIGQMQQLRSLVAGMGRTGAMSPTQHAAFDQLSGAISLPAMRSTLGELGDASQRLTDTDVHTAESGIPNWTSQEMDGGKANLNAIDSAIQMAMSKKKAIDGAIAGSPATQVAAPARGQPLTTNPYAVQ